MITVLWLIGAVVVGVIAAVLAGRVGRGNGFGLGGNLVAGVLGAVAGGYALGMAGMNLGGGLAGRLVVSFIGAVIVLFFVHAFTGRHDRHRMSS